MAARRKSESSVARSGTEQSEAAVLAASTIAAPMVQRLSSHRERISLVLQDLESERADLASRLEQLKGQADAVERAIAVHLEDIEVTLKLYETGLSSTANPQG